MRHRNGIWLAVFVLILCCLPVAASQDRNPGKEGKADLALEVEPGKLVYHDGEAVELHFILRNVSQSNLIVARRLRLMSTIALEISDSRGKIAQWCGRIAEQFDSARSYVTLSPGESVQATLTVSCVGKDDRKHAWGFTLSGPGRYIIRATYRLPRPKEYYESLFPNGRVIRGPILAKPVTIELK